MPPIRRAQLALLAFLLLLSATATANARTYYSTTTYGDWSDPTTWNLDAAPVQDPAGDVVVSSGTTLYINNNVTVASITVATGGVLSCGRRGDSPVTLTTGRISVESGGCFACTGSKSAASDCSAAFSSSPSASSSFVPYAGPQFTVRVASTQAPATADDDVRTVLIKDGGALVLAGRVRGTSAVARLAEHAMAGRKKIAVESAGPLVASSTPPWAVGDTIAIGPTDYLPDQTEYFRVVSVRVPDSSANNSPVELELDRPLQYAHSGKAYGLVHPTSSNPPNQTFVLDTRAEVALLTRNIVIEGMADDPDGLKGDVKIMGSAARAYISWVAFRDLGRRGQLGRYPLHFHGAGSGGANIQVRSVAVYRSSQRGIVVHCTSGATFADNVVADVEGFAYMLEDGAEENNVFTNNLALDVHAPDASTNSASLLTERENPAGFWFLNAANTFVGNVAAGVRGSGFALDLDPRLILRPSTYTVCPEQVPGFDLRLLDGGGSKSPAALGTSVYRALASKAFARFENNAVHAAHTGLWMTSLPQLDAALRIESFTAWKIAPRAGSASKVAFDACVRASGVLAMRLNRLACANSAMAYWSTEPGLATNTLLAWLTDGKSGVDREPQIVPSGARWQSQWTRHAGMISYLSSQTFVGTYAYGIFPGASLSSDFSVAASGSLTGAHNIIEGFRRDAVAASSPVLALDSRMQHAYTDATGDLFGQGAGARALCSCPGCPATEVDPLIAAFAPGQCRVAAVADATSRPNEDDAPQITCAGAPSLICRARAFEGPPASFVTIEIRGVSQPGRVPGQLLRVQAPFARNAVRSFSRALAPNLNVAGTSAWRFLAPMTQASADGVAGGYRVTDGSDGGFWSTLTSLSVAVGHTSDRQGALTVVISRVSDSAALYADPYPWKDLPRSQNSRGAASRINVMNGTASSSSCPVLLQTCQPPAPCVCQSDVENGFRDVYIRFQTWGDMDASILDPQGQPYLHKLTKFQVRLQLDPKSAAIAPPDDLFSSLNMALQNPPV